MVCAGPVGELAHRAYVDDVLHRVGRRLEEHHGCRGGEGRLALLEHVAVDVVGPDAPLGEQLLEDHGRRAEQGARDATIRSPDFTSAAIEVNTADIPLAVAKHASAPSSRRSCSSNMPTVGLP